MKFPVCNVWNISGERGQDILKISAVIPTKNRPHDLLVAVRSIVQQTRKPNQLIIVDQSNGALSHDLISDEMQHTSDIVLTYVHDEAIPGLVAAKAASLKFVTGDVVCFLEDDVVLDDDYIAEIESGFVNDTTMLGCSGVITNPPKTGRFYLLLFNIFHRGIYFDSRPAIYAGINRQSTELIASNVLSGGLSAWRMKVFDVISFDVENGFHMLEDFEFSRRASRFFGTRFFINPNARLEHNFSPINRDFLDLRHRRKVIEFIVYFKKNRRFPFAFTSLAWLLLGQCLDAFAQSLRTQSLKPVTGTLKGIRDGFIKHVV